MAAAARTAELKARPHIDPLARKGTFSKRGQGPLKPYGVVPTRSDEEAYMSTVEVALARHDFGEETHSPSNGVNRRGVRFGGVEFVKSGGLGHLGEDKAWEWRRSMQVHSPGGREHGGDLRESCRGSHPLEEALPTASNCVRLAW